MNTLSGTQEPPSGQGWTPSGTCGGRWSRVLPNGIWETWTPLPEGQVIIATSATAGSQWGESSLTAHEVRAMVIEIGALRAANAALEAIEYGSPNPDELRALAKVQALPLPSTMALVVLIRGADTSEQGERLLEMWLSQHDETTSTENGI